MKKLPMKFYEKRCGWQEVTIEILEAGNGASIRNAYQSTGKSWDDYIQPLLEKAFNAGYQAGCKSKPLRREACQQS